MGARVFAVVGVLTALQFSAVGASSPLRPEREQAQAQGQMRFRGMDRNGDGVITQSEWRGSAEAFRTHDWNGDGKLSGAELRPGAARGDERDEDYVPRADREFDDWTEEGFDYLDQNRDGRLTRAEWFYDRESFLRADRNRDNVLSRAEFLGDADSGRDTSRDSRPGADRHGRFESLDTNNNNRIERAEWRGTSQAFAWLDVNNDGVISRAELPGTDIADNRTDDLFSRLDRNADGRITQDEWRQDRPSFLRADRNRDNGVSRAEFEASERPGDERFEQMDSNGNGRIERREWQGRAERFDILDRNGDGVLTVAEMLETVDGSVSELFASADDNGDDRISEREWRWSRRLFLEQDVNRDGFVSRGEFLAPRSGEDATGGADNRPLNTPVVVNVNAKERWTDTGIDLQVGDVLRITSTGSIHLSGNSNDSSGAGGANRRADNAPLPNHPAGALIARVSNGAPFFIGDGTNIQTVTAAGRLYLGVNDDHLPDNSGMFRVTVLVRPR